MTGHAWPLTHDDAKTRRRKTNYTNTDTLPTRAHRARPVKKRELTNLLREDRRGQLRLSLTNTYHEWPVNYEKKQASFAAWLRLTWYRQSASLSGGPRHRNGDGARVWRGLLRRAGN